MQSQIKSSCCSSITMVATLAAGSSDRGEHKGHMPPQAGGHILRLAASWLQAAVQCSQLRWPAACPDLPYRHGIVFRAACNEKHCHSHAHQLLHAALDAQAIHAKGCTAKSTNVHCQHLQTGLVPCATSLL